MMTRTTHKSVTFTRPFRLAGVDGVLPAGTYQVDTDEELIGDLTVLAYRRVATMIHLRRNRAEQVYLIDPIDLDASLLRDTGLTAPPAGQ